MLPPKAHAQPSCGIGTGRHTALGRQRQGGGSPAEGPPGGAKNRGERGTCTQRCALRLATDCIIALIQLLRKWSHHAEPHLVTCRPGKRVIPLGGRATCTTSQPRSPVGAVPYGSRRRGARNSGRATPLPASRARRSSLILIAARQSCLVRQLRAQADRKIFHSPGAAGRGRWERVVSKNMFPGLRVRSASLQKPTEGPIRIFSVPSGWATVRGPMP
jgi:hypothetical protein